MRLTLIWSISMVLLLPNCSQVPVKDQVWWGTKGIRGAVEVHTLQTGTKQISFEDWLKMIRIRPMLCTSVETFAQIKGDYEKFCSYCNCCQYDTNQTVKSSFNNLERATK